jgi:lipopolysaccharide transport system ATP-binding protein
MYMRLAFAVAAHFESDILIVDEVLAVGDAAFQAKCLGRIADLGASGRTVIFVSHSMPSILRLCTRALLLDRGQRVTDGPTHEVIRTYLESELGKSSERRWASIEDAPGDRVAKLRSIRVLPGDGNSSDEIDIRQPIEIEVEFVSEAPGELRPSVNLHFYNDEGVCLFVSNDWNDRQSWARRRSAGVTRSTCRIPGNFLAEGRVVVTVAVSTYHPIVVHALERDAVAFQIVDRSQGDGVRGLYANEWPGVVRPMLDWQVEALPR